MFERLIRELKELERTKLISVPIEADQDGYLDRECPNNDCLFQFKVDEADWEELFKDEKVFCPQCRHEAKSDAWFTTEQIEQAKDQAFKHIHGRIDKALEQGARDFNSKQPRNSFIKMSVKVTGTKPMHYIMPVPSKEEMQLKIQCKVCNAKYAVIGSAFFCPCCGHNSAQETFDNSLKKIQDKIKNIPIIRKAVESVSKDEAENTCRSLVETSLGECVVAFQRFCEVDFTKRAPEKTIKFNAFQNIEIGSTYWNDIIGESYSNWLTIDELTRLNLLFQKRHLLAHTEGIVDQKYLDKTSDSSYKVGQRIVIKEKDVLELIGLVKKLVDTLRQK
ncbi:MAG: hypothetical protein FD181_1015 [Prolixibacteraceae bacterium]|nr:MAG: hypothetical protein FD181_1015 [Prolixibacteraceae bacterium]